MHTFSCVGSKIRVCRLFPFTKFVMIISPKLWQYVGVLDTPACIRICTASKTNNCGCFSYLLVSSNFPMNCVRIPHCSPGSTLAAIMVPQHPSVNSLGNSHNCKYPTECKESQQQAKRDAHKTKREQSKASASTLGSAMYYPKSSSSNFTSVCKSSIKLFNIPMSHALKIQIQTICSTYEVFFIENTINLAGSHWPQTLCTHAWVM